MSVDVMPRDIVFKNVTLSGLSEVATKLLEFMDTCRVCILSGEMGAGKTTLVKAIGHVLNVRDTMSSPSFSIINEYYTHNGDFVYHFDFYRIKSEAEAFDTGAEEYFNSGNYCFVEWPEKIKSLLPDIYAQLTILVEDDTHRTIELSLHG